MTGWTTDLIPDQHGRIAVVTGANSGLGLVTATELARRGAHVVLAVRDHRRWRKGPPEASAAPSRRYATWTWPRSTRYARSPRSWSPTTPRLTCW